MDLSKSSDAISDDLLLAKLKAYGFSRQALSFMCSFLKKEDKEFKSTINSVA